MGNRPVHAAGNRGGVANAAPGWPRSPCRGGRYWLACVSMYRSLRNACSIA